MPSKLLVNHLDHVSNRLVLVGLHEPLSEVALYRNVQLLLLVRGEPGLFYFLLNFCKALQPTRQHILVVLWTEYECLLIDYRLRSALLVTILNLPRKDQLVEIGARNQIERLAHLIGFAVGALRLIALGHNDRLPKVVDGFLEPIGQR